MKISSICSRRIVSIDAGSSLVEAAALMREQHVGALVVTSQTPEGPGVAGVVTDRDLAIDVLARGLDVATGPIGKLARRELVSVTEDQDISAAIALMRDSGVRRLLVTDAEGRLTGIVSLDDMLDACAELFSGLAAVMHSGISRETAAARPMPPAPALRIPAMGTAGWRM